MSQTGKCVPSRFGLIEALSNPMLINPEVYMGKIKILQKLIFGLTFCVMSGHAISKSEASISNKWQFSLSPLPHLSKWGNVMRHNKLFINLSESCEGSMGVFFGSKNREKLIQAEGKMLPFQFTVSLFEHTEVIQTESEVIYVLTDYLDGEETDFVMSVLLFTAFDNVNDLRPLSGYQMTTFNLTAEDNEIYDSPNENWDLDGFETALNNASDWCWEKQKRNFKHKSSETMYYVSL